MEQHPYHYPQYPDQVTSQLPPVQSNSNDTLIQVDTTIAIIGKVISTLVLGFISLYYFTSDRPWTLFDAADLLIHEAGHFIWYFAGEFIAILGGSLTQLLVPIGFGIYFLLYKRWYSLLFTLYWFGINLIYVAIYISDAQAQVLPLINENLIHDWNYLLTKVGLLQHDQAIGNIIQWIGKFSIFGSLIAMVMQILKLFLERQKITP